MAAATSSNVRGDVNEYADCDDDDDKGAAKFTHWRNNGELYQRLQLLNDQSEERLMDLLIPYAQVALIRWSSQLCKYIKSSQITTFKCYEPLFPASSCLKSYGILWSSV